MIHVIHSPPTDKSQTFHSGYTLRQASKLIELSEGQIRTFIRAGFLKPRRGGRGAYRFSFQDLVMLRTAKELTAKLSPRRVRRALQKLKDQLPEGRELSALRIVAEGEDLVVREGLSTWNPESGQTLINFEVAELAAEVAPLARAAVQAARGGEERLSAEEWYELGCDLETHEPDQARDAYRRSLELDPRQPDAHLNLGRLLHEAGELQAASAHYRLAMEMRPRDATAAYNLGVSLQDLKQPHQAVKAYIQALQWDPRSADAHFNLAQLYEEMGSLQLALKHWQIYRELIGQG